MPWLRVTAIRDDGTKWAVDVRTLRQARKVARNLRWRRGWPAWIYRGDQPADLVLIDCWRRWHLRQRLLHEAPVAGIH